jgi:hypothetical protein
MFLVAIRIAFLPANVRVNEKLIALRVLRHLSQFDIRFQAFIVWQSSMQLTTIFPKFLDVFLRHWITQLIHFYFWE